MPTVKAWVPCKECEQCRQAERIMDDMQRSNAFVLAKATKKIREQAKEIRRLKQVK